jgi:hypothetical protein
MIQTRHSFSILKYFTLLGGLILIGLSPVWACEEEADFTNVREELNHGYAILHQSFKGLAWADELLYIKRESDKADKMISKLAENYKEIQKKLEKMEKDFPAICLKNSGQPWVVRQKNKAVSKDRINSFISLKGNRKGINFERTFLLSLSAAMNQMNHLSQVMLEKETDKGLRAFLTDIQTQVEQLYDETVAMLNKHYFIQE